MTKNNASKYKVLSDIDHTLLRPASFLGSIVTEKSLQYVKTENHFCLEEVEFNPGFHKLFDEIISNSVDESKRPGTKLNTIKITINTEENYIEVYDNGGIPVEIHKETGMYIPEVIFGNLRSSSNYDDEEERSWIGVNGLGSKLTNIFSTFFEVETADGKNKFSMTWKNNMKNHEKFIISRSNLHYTRIKYKPDLKRFGLSEISENDIKIIEKRIYEISGCNPKLNIFFQNKKINVKSFSEYCRMYLCDNDAFIYEENKDWQVGISLSKLDSFQQVSYVNSVYTKDGGTHCDYIINQIIYALKEKIKKKYKIELMPAQIKNHIFLFVNSTIIRPSFSSQTKEKLISNQKAFGTEIVLSDKFIKEIFKSEIIQSILDWAKRKSEADEAAALRKAQKNLDRTKIAKLIDAKKKGLRNDCVLQIYEGDSASNAVRQYRDPQLQGAFPIRGKFLNVFDVEPSRAMQNEEVKSICAAMGLKIGERATATNLRYGKIALYTDSDQDGRAISALLLNFFYKYWPELVKEGRIFQVETPIVVAKKGKETLKFYYDNEYQEWVDKVGAGIKQWNVEYKKGLAALENYEYKEIIQNPRMIQFTEDDTAKDQFKIWFGDDSDLRKNKILNKPVEIKEKVVEKKQEPKAGEKIEKPVVKEEPKIVVEAKKNSSSTLKERLQRNINKQAESSSKVKKGLF